MQTIGLQRLRGPVLFTVGCTLCGGVMAVTHAYSDNSIFALQFSGATVLAPVRTALFNTASTSRSGTDNSADPVDPRQALSDQGPFPPENHWAPSAAHAVDYVRADSALRIRTVPGLDGETVAEGSLDYQGVGSASATGTVSFGLRQTADAPVTISFRAWPHLSVDTSQTSEVAYAALSFTMVLKEAGTERLLLKWTPNGDPRSDYQRYDGSVTTVKDPFTLNRLLVAAGGASDSWRMNDTWGDFSLDYRLRPDAEFTAFILWNDDVRVSVTAVPEPPPLWLGAVGVVLLLLRRRHGA